MERTYFVGRKFTEYAINIRLKELNVAKIVKILVHEVRDLAENVFQGHAMRRRNARALLSRHVMTTVSDLESRRSAAILFRTASLVCSFSANSRTTSK